MKKTMIPIWTILLLFTCQFTFSQEFNGKAYYQTQRKIDLKLNDAQMTDEQKAQMQAMLKKQFEKTYILTFNREESNYKMEEELEAPSNNSGSMGVKVMTIGGNSDLTYYKNTKSKQFSREQDLFGKLFLVKDELETYNWEFKEETKIIGNYLCFKAIAKKEVENLSMSFSSEDDESENNEPEKVKETKIITAWYTTDIPINNGPDDFWGLPGLILELHDGDDMSYLCTKLVLNSKDKTEIKEPTNGKVVTNEEYRELMEKKMKEMQEQYGGRERKGSHEGSFSIKIGG